MSNNLDSLLTDHEQTGFDRAIHATTSSTRLEFDLSKWNIEEVFDDVVYAEIIDTSSEEGFIVKNGLHIPTNNAAKEFFRFLKVIKTGNKCAESLKPGTICIVPNIVVMSSVGMKKEKKTFHFIPQKSIMAIVSPA